MLSLVMFVYTSGFWLSADRVVEFDEEVSNDVMVPEDSQSDLVAGRDCLLGLISRDWKDSDDPIGWRDSSPEPDIC